MTIQKPILPQPRSVKTGGGAKQQFPISIGQSGFDHQSRGLGQHGLFLVERQKEVAPPFPGGGNVNEIGATPDSTPRNPRCGAHRLRQRVWDGIPAHLEFRHIHNAMISRALSGLCATVELPLPVLCALRELKEWELRVERHPLIAQGELRLALHHP